MALSKYSGERKKMVEYLRSQLIGPAGGTGETFTLKDKPTDRYLMGKLFPRDAETVEVLEEQEEEEANAADSSGTEDGWTDSPISLAFQRLPARSVAG